MQQIFAFSLMIGAAIAWSKPDCFAQQREDGPPPCTIPLPVCAADIAPPGGDGAANVQDLLAVINTFGQNGVPTNQRPQGDCAPLPNGDCVVNVLDLLAVINSWGACEPICSPRIPPNDACVNVIAGNGGADGVYGTRPLQGWHNGNLGLMEDAILCAGGVIDALSATFIDQTAAGVNTISAYDQIRVRIYDLNGQPISALNPASAVPIFAQDFTVGANCTKQLCGVFYGLEEFDMECWSVMIDPPLNLPAVGGTYGVYFSFPQLTNGTYPSVYLATGGGAPNETSPLYVHIWGFNGVTPYNSGTLQHSAFCLRKP